MENKKTALLIIDMINDFNFDYGESLAQKTIAITEPILSIKQEFKQRGLPVIYINDHYNLWKADIDKIIDYCLNEKSEKIINKIAPDADDYFLIKPKHSAFYGTALHTLLQQLDVLEERRRRILQLLRRLLVIERTGQCDKRRQLLHIHVRLISFRRAESQNFNIILF